MSVDFLRRRIDRSFFSYFQDLFHEKFVQTVGFVGKSFGWDLIFFYKSVFIWKDVKEITEQEGGIPYVLNLDCRDGT